MEIENIVWGNANNKKREQDNVAQHKSLRGKNSVEAVSCLPGSQTGPWRVELNAH